MPSYSVPIVIYGHRNWCYLNNSNNLLLCLQKAIGLILLFGGGRVQHD